VRGGREREERRGERGGRSEYVNNSMENIIRRDK
tara:strand:- start:115 stop:216 length:102 start_codon:yes stop_codon:yes gene_type:complete